MDALNLVEEIIGHLAWPTTVFLVIYLFRKPFRSLIGHIKSMSYKEGAINFSLQGKIEEQTKKKGGIFNVTKENLTYDNYLDAIMLLSNWYANAVLFIPPAPELDWQRKTAIYTLEQSERKLKEAGRGDKAVELILVLIQALRAGLRKQ